MVSVAQTPDSSFLTVRAAGVPQIEELSRNFRRAFQTEPYFGEMDTFYSMILSLEQKIELATRIETMNTLMRRLKGKGRSGGDGTEEENLFGLLFHLVFPIFGAE